MRSADPSVPGVLEQLGDGLGGQGVTVAVGHEAHGPGVAEGHLAVLVADDHALGEGVEGPSQPDGVGAGLGHRLGRLAGHLLEVAEHRFHAPFVGRLHPQPVGQGGQSLLQGCGARPGGPSRAAMTTARTATTAKTMYPMTYGFTA